VATAKRRGRDTTMTKLKPEFLINDETELRSMFKPTRDLAVKKCLSQLDAHSKDFIARSPFVCVGTQTEDGKADVSPRGDPCGFVKVLDDETLLIPDRPGNNRFDTQANILANPAVGLMFMIPGYDETLRVNGTAQLTRDPELLELMAVNDRVPALAIAVSIDEVFLHCAKAFRRSKLWDPSQLQDRSEMPSLMNMILDQTEGAPKEPKEMAELDANLEESYKKSMY